MIISYELSEKQVEKFLEFRKSVYAKVHAKQLAENPNIKFPGPNVPYSGVCGGDTTWSITETSIGTVVKVEVWDEELDLTDYECW